MSTILSRSGPTIRCVILHRLLSRQTHSPSHLWLLLFQPLMRVALQRRLLRFLGVRPDESEISDPSIFFGQYPAVTECEAVGLPGNGHRVVAKPRWCTWLHYLQSKTKVAGRRLVLKGRVATERTLLLPYDLLRHCMVWCGIWYINVVYEGTVEFRCVERLYLIHENNLSSCRSIPAPINRRYSRPVLFSIRIMETLFMKAEEGQSEERTRYTSL